MADRFLIIARANANLRGISCNHFMHNGEIYPRLSMAAPKVALPPLHYSLYAEFEETQRLMEDADATLIRNFFSAVISHSENELVFSELLPSVLINKLKQKLHPLEFAALNRGSMLSVNAQPIEVTLDNIQKLKEHYRPVITLIQHLLMDKLLLQE